MTAGQPTVVASTVGAGAVVALGGEAEQATTAHRVVGIDLSLTSTGISNGLTYADLITPKVRGWARWDVIHEAIRTYTVMADLVVIEGLAFHAYDAGSERAGLHWSIRRCLHRKGIPTAVASPQAIKKYATGAGTAKKDAVLAAAIRRWPNLEIAGNDQADAVVLAAMGLDWLGGGAVVPDSHRSVLAKIDWPERVAA